MVRPDFNRSGGTIAGPNVVWIEGASATAGAKRWLYTDHQGSVIAAGLSRAAPSQINRDDQYGVPDAANSGRFQYTGQAWIPELGMYHYKARIYAPDLGRFLQTDPVGYKVPLGFAGPCVEL
jgi:RHS repeat-associated protein